MRLIAYTFTASFIAMTFLLQWWQQESYPLWTWIVLLTLLCIGAGTVTIQRCRAIGIVILCIAGSAALSLLRIGQTLPVSTIPMDAETAKNVTIEGAIIDYPDNSNGRIRYTIQSKSLQVGTGASINIDERILVTDRNMWPRFVIGDELRVTGRMMLPATDGYGNYLSVSGIRWTMQARFLERITEHNQFSPWFLLGQTREAFSFRINRIFPEPSAALLDGILTGNRAGLSQRLQDVFRTTGLTHMLAVSGFNITIVLSMMSSFLFFLPFRWKLIPSIVAVILFTLFVGAGASVVRACVMGILGLIALHMERPKDMRLLILWTACFMLLWNPRSLWYDAGFQLSFLSVIGLTELQSILGTLLKKVPTAGGMKDALLTTMAAQITATPWVVFRFGQLSLISPIANLLVAPLIPLAMLTGFLSIIGSLIWMPLGQLIGITAYGLLTLAVILTELCSRIPYASVSIGGFGFLFICLYYAALTIFLWRYKKAPAGSERLKPKKT